MMSVSVMAAVVLVGLAPPWGPPMNCGGGDVCYQGCANADARTHQYCNLSLTIEERLDSLSALMSVTEKTDILKAHAHVSSHLG